LHGIELSKLILGHHTSFDLIVTSGPFHSAIQPEDILITLSDPLNTKATVLLSENGKFRASITPSCIGKFSLLIKILGQILQENEAIVINPEPKQAELPPSYTDTLKLEIEILVKSVMEKGIKVNGDVMYKGMSAKHWKSLAPLKEFPLEMLATLFQAEKITDDLLSAMTLAFEIKNR